MITIQTASCIVQIGTSEPVPIAFPSCSCKPIRSREFIHFNSLLHSSPMDRLYAKYLNWQQNHMQNNFLVFTFTQRIKLLTSFLSLYYADRCSIDGNPRERVVVSCKSPVLPVPFWKCYTATIFAPSPTTMGSIVMSTAYLSGRYVPR